MPINHSVFIIIYSSLFMNSDKGNHSGFSQHRIFSQSLAQKRSVSTLSFAKSVPENWCSGTDMRTSYPGDCTWKIYSHLNITWYLRLYFLAFSILKCLAMLKLILCYLDRLCKFCSSHFKKKISSERVPEVFNVMLSSRLSSCSGWPCSELVQNWVTENSRRFAFRKTTLVKC